MSLARASCVALIGIEGHLVEVEVHLSEGLPGVTLIGLPDASLYEARDRVKSAVLNSGHKWPSQRITVGLFPAALPKSGSGFDAAVAAAVFAAAGEVPADALTRRVLLGELALDGRIRPLPGVVAAVLALADAGLSRVVVPAANAQEAALVPGVQVEPIDHLRDLVRLLRGEPIEPFVPHSALLDADRGKPPPDFAEVVGQPTGRLAMELAAAGGHHVLMLGPPGAGKTMLAERLPGLLPPLSNEQALEVTAVHSVAGALPLDAPMVRRPPFRSPHHSASLAALVGGGSRVLRPGAASLAHRGVLFLDEAPEFAPRVLDALRQPLESGVVEVARASGVARFPARFTLVLAANPCPCGKAGTPRGDAACTCQPRMRLSYRGRLSGPLLDRVDVRIRLDSPTKQQLRAASADAESTEVVAARVRRAREAARKRLAGTPWATIGDVPGPALRARWGLPPPLARIAEHQFERGGLTARGLDRVLRTAWTLADLVGDPAPARHHVDQALELRLTGAGW
jgi:magnesium chelatase family protein